MILQLRFLILMILYISSADSYCAGNVRKPAFFTALTRRETELTSNSVVQFDVIITNVGSRYDSSSGCFTVPRKGTYEFAVNFVSGKSWEWLEMNLMKNNNLIVNEHAEQVEWSSGSLQVILELEEGDQIYINHPRPTGYILGENYSMFSGHFL